MNESKREALPPRRGAIGKALIVWLLTGSVGLALLVLLVFGVIGC